MIKFIKKCERCKLCLNQKPLLDLDKESTIIWLGLSAKRVNNLEEDVPLSSDTNSGSIISKIELKLKNNISTYRSNIVKCLPLDEKGKIRYPSNDEMNTCFSNLLIEIKCIKPKIIFLLGDKVTHAIERNLKIKFSKKDGYCCIPIEKDGIYYISIYHPSYIYSYKRKEENLYINNIIDAVEKLLKK